MKRYCVCAKPPSGEHEKTGPSIGEMELSKPSKVEKVEPLSSVVLDKRSSSLASTLTFMASTASISGTSLAPPIEDAESSKSVVF